MRQSYYCISTPSRTANACFSLRKVSVCLFCLNLFYLFGTATYGQAEPEPRRHAATETAAEGVAQQEQIARWIRDLDNDRFVVREAAQQQLTAAADRSISAVAARAGDFNASLESTTRAVRILTDWSESKDPSLRIAALESLAALKNCPTEAAMAVNVLAMVREQAAIQKIEQLGGTCLPVDSRANHVLLPIQYRNKLPLRVTIGPQWKGTDRDLRMIAQIRRTQVVSLHSAPVGDEALEHLAGIARLNRVEIYGTKFSPEVLAALREQLPESVTLEVRPSGARLGIGGNRAQGGAHVTQVLPGSAAEKAGLQVRDIITQFDGKPVDSFETLTELIAKHQPGDTVELTIVRAGKPLPEKKVKPLTKKVTFDRWGGGAQHSPSKRQPPAVE